MFHLQMGTVSYFTDFFLFHTLQKPILCVSIILHVLCFAVCWSSRCLFSLLWKHGKTTQILQRRFTEHVLCLCLDVNDIMTFSVLVYHFLAQVFLGRKKTILLTARLWLELRCFAPPRSGCLCVVQWVLLHMELLSPSVKALHDSPGQSKPLIWEVLWDLEGRFMMLIISLHLRQMSYTPSCGATRRLHLKCMRLKHLC